jgi:hypothetical protein
MLLSFRDNFDRFSPTHMLLSFSHLMITKEL